MLASNGTNIPVRNRDFFSSGCKVEGLTLVGAFLEGTTLLEKEL
jgi:hypothetical protein